MRTSKKLLSVLLTIIMVFSLMLGGLTTAFAATATDLPTSTAADDGYFNAAELTAGVTIDAPLGTSGAVAGDTIQLLVDTVPVATLDHTLTAAEETAGTYSFTVNATHLGADGAKAITTRIVDAASNVGLESPPLNVTMDTTAPTITSITSDATAAGVLKIGQTITFTLTPGATELGATVVGSYNGQALTWSTVDLGVTYTATYTVTQGDTDQATALQISGVTITDAAGNVSTATSGSDIAKTIDANAPTAPTITTPPQSVNTNTITITGTAETDSTVNITGGSSPATGIATSGSYSIDVTLTADTINTLSVTATDAAGNVSSPATVSITQDSTAPAVTGVIEGGFYQTASPTFTEGTATLNNVAYTSGTPIAGDSAQELVVTDAAGNVTTVNFTTDNTSPAVPAVDIVEGDLYDANGVTPTISNAPADATQTITLDGAPYTNGAITTDGAHTLVITNTDAAGNASSITVNFTVDAVVPVAPQITNTGYINSTNEAAYAITGTGEASATVNVTVTDSASPSVTVTGTGTVDGSGNISATVDTSTLAEGTISITATQTDAAGNVSLSSTPVSVIKDTVAPTATISGVTEGQITNQSVTPNATGGDTYVVTLTNNGTAVASYALGNAITADGSYALSVTPTDAAGNTGSATVVNFTIDTTTPTVTKLGDGTADYMILAAGTATLAFNEPLSAAGKSAVEAALTLGADQVIAYAWDATDSTLTITGHATLVTTFANDVVADVEDAASNIAIGLLLVDSSSASTAKAITVFDFATPTVTGTVDETAKTVDLTVPFGTDVTALVPTITHTGASVSPDTGVEQDFTSPVIYTVTAEDASTQDYTVTVTVAPDTTAPTLSVTSASAVTDTTATLNFTSDEAGTYYYLVYAATDAAPDAATIKLQGAAVAKGTAAALAAGNTANVTGMTASTAYNAYVIVEDAVTNASAVSIIAVTTTAAPVEASVASIAATNGTVTITLAAKPTVAPVAGDFTATSQIDAGTANTLALAGFNYDNNVTVTYTFTPVAQTVADQSVVVVVTLATVETAAPSFTIAAASVAVTGVTLDQATLALTAGGATGTLVETITPANATDQSVSWASDTLGVATVDNFGVVTPVAAGTAIITVTTTDGGFTATSAVTVNPAAPDVTADDANNVILSADDTMEYSTDGTAWTAYDTTNQPTFSGNVTVEVRVAANAGTGAPAGDITTLTFTTNPVPYASTDALTNATVSVVNGTVEADAIAALDQTVGVVGTSSETGTATIAWTIASYSSTTAGDYTATGVLTLPAGWTGTAPNVTATVAVQPVAVTLSSIAITTSATKLIYTVGDALDISGMEVTGTYSDGSTAVETITSIDVAGFDSSAPAVDQVLTITVGGKTTTYTVAINAAPVTPAAPSVTNDDTANTVTGMAVGMEYNLDAAGYVVYDAITFDAIDLSGDHTLLVRIAAEGINPASADTTLTFTAMLGEDKKVTSISGNNILLVGDYAFDLSDPANNNYSLNNFLVAANTAYLNAGTYEVYFRIGDTWYDIVSDQTMATPILDLSKINGDGLFNYMNMQ